MAGGEKCRRSIVSWRDQDGARTIEDVSNPDQMIFNHFSLINIGEHSCMGLSNLFARWQEAGYTQPTITEPTIPTK